MGKRSEFQYSVSGNYGKLGVYAVGCGIGACFFAYMLLQNLRNEIHADVNTGKFWIDVIELIAERASLGWWFSTLAIGIGLLTFFICSVLFFRIWQKRLLPLAVKDNWLYIFEKPRFEMSKFQSFEPSGTGQKATIQGNLLTGSSVNLAAIAILDDNASTVVDNLNSFLSPV